MKMKAYINLDWLDEDVDAMPGEEEDTVSRMKKKLKKCSKIPGLVEMHIVFGPIEGVAEAEVDTMEELTNVINEIQKVFPVTGYTTLIVQPQLMPGETPKNPNFT